MSGMGRKQTLGSKLHNRSVVPTRRAETAREDRRLGSGRYLPFILIRVGGSPFPSRHSQNASEEGALEKDSLPLGRGRKFGVFGHHLKDLRELARFALESTFNHQPQ